MTQHVWLVQVLDQIIVYLVMMVDSYSNLIFIRNNECISCNNSCKKCTGTLAT